MRQHLAAIAHRPWFGQECETRVPLHLQLVQAVPAASVGKSNAHAPGLPAHALPLPDLPGECVFDYARDCCDVEGKLSGLVSFRKLTCAIAFVKVELIKVEWSQQESMDTAVWTNARGRRRRDPSRLCPTFDGGSSFDASRRRRG